MGQQDNEPSNVIQIRPTGDVEQLIYDGEIVADPFDATVDPIADTPLTRPGWLGVNRQARRTQGRMWRRAWRRILRRVKTLPRLLVGRPIRWFFLGIKGWPGFVHWMFAVPEHQSVGVERTVRKGSKTTVSTRTRKQAWAMTAMQTGIVAVLPPVVALWIVDYLGAEWTNWWWLVCYTPHIIGTAVYGALNDTKPVKPVVTVRARGEADPTAMTLVLRDVGLLKKPDKNNEGGEYVTYSTVPTPEGVGWVHSYELPRTCGKHAGHVKAKKDEIAAALGVDPDWVDITGKGHRFQVWLAEDDPFAEPTESPLMTAEAHCVFDPIPVGLTVRGRQVRMPIVGTHFLSAGLPAVGKSGFARALTLGVILDPHADIHVFDGKGGKDWQPLHRVATTMENGPLKEQIPRLKKWLEWSTAEAERRAALIRGMPDEEAPEAKITRRMHQTDVMRFQWLILDEAHLFFEDPDILDALIHYVKERRFVGFGIIIITQTVEGKLAERFTGLRSAVGSRIALRLMDWVASNQTLGDQMNTKGWNAGDLPDVPGLAIVRGDMDADGNADKGAGKVRAHWVTIPDLRDTCRQGEFLRGLADQDGNPLPQVETQDEELSAAELLARLHTHAPEELPSTVVDPTTLGAWLSTKGLAARKTGGVMCRSRTSTEALLGLPAGSLADTTPEPQGTALDPTRTPHGDPDTEEPAT